MSPSGPEINIPGGFIAAGGCAETSSDLLDLPLFRPLGSAVAAVIGTEIRFLSLRRLLSLPLPLEPLPSLVLVVAADCIRFRRFSNASNSS